MKTLGKTVLGTGAVVLSGAAAYYLYERNTEQPKYELVVKDGRFEVRDYPGLLVAETLDGGPRQKTLNSGFHKLADYIFAKSRRGSKIAMTAPVLQDRAEQGIWRTRFIMPAKYTLATLPQPPKGVAIAERPARRFAVIRFSGSANDEAVAAREAELRRWMGSHDLKAGASSEYGFYNSPFIPAFFRRNEILIPVER